MSPLVTFLILAVLLLVVGLAWVLWPLLRRPDTGTGVDRVGTTLEILRGQLADLKAEFERGAISQALYDETRAELERRVLEEAQADPAAPARSAVPVGRSPRARWTAATVALLVPLAAAGLYWKLGEPAAFDPPPPASDSTHAFTPEQINDMLAKLAQRLEQQPDDSRGWSVLARSYYAMQRYPEAAAAYEKLLALEPDNPDVLVDYADTLGVAQQRQLAGKPMELVQRALKLNPDHWKALALAGTDAFDRKDYATAVRYWERVKQVVPDSPIAESIDSSIAEARQLGGLAAVAATLPAARPDAAASVPAAPPAAAPGPMAAAAPASVEASDPKVAAARIEGTVKLDPKLAGKTAPTDVVFVYARLPEGSKMPLAIQRFQVKDLPARFVLDDSQAMTPQMKLSTVTQVVVGARISKTGQAIAAPGDLEGKTAALKPGARDLVVTIDASVP